MRSLTDEDKTRYLTWIAFDAIVINDAVTRPSNEWISHTTATASTTPIQNHSRMRA